MDHLSKAAVFAHLFEDIQKLKYQYDKEQDPEYKKYLKSRYEHMMTFCCNITDNDDGKMFVDIWMENVKSERFVIGIIPP
jgi:hypothetical protein